MFPWIQYPEIHSGERYNGISTLVDLSVNVKIATILKVALVLVPILTCIFMVDG
jgi:hypothetical protein